MPALVLATRWALVVWTVLVDTAPALWVDVGPYMIRMVHFATRRGLIPLLHRYQVDPDMYWTWMRAPLWLRKMWDVANRERQRQRNARKGSPFQHWRYPATLGLPKCIDVTNPTIWRHKKT